jgi:hypothetical protein
MKNYIILFREPDGRMNEHSQEELSNHREHWAQWLSKWQGEGRLSGGNSLTLEGRLITGDGSTIVKTIHRVGTEIIGGFLLLKAQDLDEAAAIASSCPIYEAKGYAEVRELAG